MERLDPDNNILMALRALDINCNEKTIDLILRLHSDDNCANGAMSLLRIRSLHRETENAFKTNK